MRIRGRRVGDNTGSGLTSWRGTNPGPRTPFPFRVGRDACCGSLLLVAGVSSSTGCVLASSGADPWSAVADSGRLRSFDGGFPVPAGHQRGEDVSHRLSLTTGVLGPRFINEKGRPASLMVGGAGRPKEDDTK
jgi:hypothetical protein